MHKSFAFRLFFLFATTFAFGQESYYSDVNLNLTGISLKEELAIKIINTHTQFLFYDQVWDASKSTDVNPTNSQEVLLIYGFEDGTDADITNDSAREIDNNGGNSGNWNREHVYSQSLGTPALSDSGPGSDAHHLRPADAQRNSSRNNRKFTEGSGNSGAQSNAGWYPGDEWKGDVARMMMYMYVRYDERCLPSNIGIGDRENTPDDMIDLFLQWNVEDPVSEFERQRNSYHENTSNENAQGNRNPFIDNPILASRIWGGTNAEDTWGIFTNTDNEAPSVPENISFSNITTYSIDISWDASTDNIETTSYDVFVDGKLVINTTTTNTSISGLDSNTNYSFTVLAKDIANNLSAQSSAVDAKTLEDTTAPTVPQNIVISNETGESFKISWDASNDNSAVTGYDVYIDGNNIATINETTHTVTNLTTSTTYDVQILAKDAVDNKSDLSIVVNATTTDGFTTTANELFFSEYFEGSYGSNKALEIVNLTSFDVDMTQYSIQRQTNGGLNGAEWEYNLSLTGILKSNNVYVIINSATTIQKLIDEADFIHLNDVSTNYGAPISFNGNDPVGLFKNDILIDIIGTYNGGSSNFAKDKTLRRKSGVSQPNTVFDIDNEWDVYDKDTVDDFGTHSAIILGIDNFDNPGVQFFPNPVENKILINNTFNKSIEKVSIYSLLGEKIITLKNNPKEINVNFLSKGFYILKFEIETKLYATKFIKK